MTTDVLQADRGGNGISVGPTAISLSDRRVVQLLIDGHFVILAEAPVQIGGRPTGERLPSAVAAGHFPPS